MLERRRKDRGDRSIRVFDGKRKKKAIQGTFRCMSHARGDSTTKDEIEKTRSMEGGNLK